MKGEYETISEIWRDIGISKGRYEISNLGKIRRKNDFILFIRNGKSYTKKDPKTCLIPKVVCGYYQVGMRCINKRIWVSIHRELAIAFIPRKLGKNHVNHIDGNKMNNNLDNLEWVTPKENIHKYMKSNNGLANGSKLTIPEIRELRRLFKSESSDLKLQLVFNTVTRASIYSLRHGKTYSHIK